MVAYRKLSGVETPLTRRSLARTYSHPSYADPWEAVGDYRRVQEYISHHPDAGRTRVGNALDLPPSRVRGWMGNMKPDALRAIEVGEERGWFDAKLESDIFAAFNVLVASVLSGGSIAERTLKPSFNSQKSAVHVLDALDTVGLGWTTRHADAESRPMEITPSEHGVVLGRALTVLGAPVGEKSGDVYFPPYLSGAHSELRQAFAAIYISNRGTPNSSGIQIWEDRSETYIRQLREFFSRTLDVEVTRSGKNLRFGIDATAKLRENGFELSES